MTTTTTPPRTLREEDFEVGKPFVHPETRLEYADFHAYICGKDPVPHWRNARIKDVHAGVFDHTAGALDVSLGQSEEKYRQAVAKRRAALLDLYHDSYDRDGRQAGSNYLFAGRRGVVSFSPSA